MSKTPGFTGHYPAHSEEYGVAQTQPNLRRKRMAQIDFGGVTEEVITSEEFTVEQARDMFPRKPLPLSAMVSRGPGRH
jgi:hypothetical protein